MKNEIQKATPTSVSYALANGDNITLDAETVKNYLTNGNGQVSDKEVAESKLAEVMGNHGM